MPKLSICLGDNNVQVNHKSCEQVNNALAQPGGEEQVLGDGYSLFEQDEVCEEYPDLEQGEKVKTQLHVQCDSQVEATLSD